MQQQQCQLRRTPRRAHLAPLSPLAAGACSCWGYIATYQAGQLGQAQCTTFLLLLRLLFKRFIVTLISFPWFSTVFLPPQFFCYVGGCPFSAQTELYLYYIKVQWLIEFKVVTKHDISLIISNFTFSVKARCETVTFDDKIKQCFFLQCHKTSIFVHCNNLNIRPKNR